MSRDSRDMGSEEPRQTHILLAIDASDNAFNAMQLFTQVIDLRLVHRVKVLLLAWPEPNAHDTLPPIDGAELDRFERFIWLLENDGAIIEGERASGASAEEVLAAAEAIDASMILLDLAWISGDNRSHRLAAQIVDSAPVPVISLLGTERRIA